MDNSHTPNQTRSFWKLKPSYQKLTRCSRKDLRLVNFKRL